MSKRDSELVTLAELNILLNAPLATPSEARWADALCVSGDAAPLSDDDLLELASAFHPLGPRAAIDSLLTEVTVRLAYDHAASAALAAIRHYHLPHALDAARL